jgi:hypothetical protein
VTINGFRIRNRTYWTLKQFLTTLCISPSHTDYYSQPRTSLRCWVTSSNTGHSSAPGLITSQAGVCLTPTSLKSNSKLYYNWRPVDKSSLVSSPIWGPRPDICYCQTVAGLLMWGALSDYCCWSSPAQSFSGSSPTGLVTIFYCLRFETPQTWTAISYYFHSRLRVRVTSWLPVYRQLVLIGAKPLEGHKRFFFCNWTLAVIVITKHHLWREDSLKTESECESESESYVTAAVSRQVCPGIKHPSGAYDQIFITVRHLRGCWCGALSLTRGRACRLQFLLAPASAVILGSESR